MNFHSNPTEDESRGYDGNGQNSREVYSSSEINRLSGKLNKRVTQEMNDLMCSVSSQIPRAISEAINEQVLPHIQASLSSGQRQVPNRGLEVPDRRQECRSEEAQNRRICSWRIELPGDFNRNEVLENTHYNSGKFDKDFAVYKA